MNRLKPKLTLFVLAVFILGMVGSLINVPAMAAPTQPKANWSPCYREFGPSFECTTVQVPLDYSNPGKAAISIAMIRLPASNPEERIGSLFLNPGGPGGSGFDFALFVSPFLYTPEVRARFDIVGFDTRGVARSTALRCFGTPRQWGPYFTPFAFPITPEEEQIWINADLYLVDACDQRGTRMIDHMSTADVARDLDLLRQAVGDEQLNYAGFSYGSYLGVTYANMFPDKVRALVVDAVLDPIAWATGSTPEEGATVPFSTRLRSDEGAMETLGEFFRLCDAGGPSCAFSGDAEERYAALAARLLAEPILVTTPDGATFPFTYQDLIGLSLGAMYDSFSWPEFASTLAFIEAFAPPAEIGAQIYAFWERLGLITKRGFPNYPNFVEGFPGVACSDSDNPHDYAAWSAAADAAEAGFGYFGRIWTWVSSICAHWPGSQDSRYAGPFTNHTANPVLVVGNFYDPATRYEGAVTVANLLPNSRLLSLNGWGHASLFLSQCIDLAVSDYLLSGALPAEGTVCNQDLVPFIDFSVMTGAAEMSAARRSLVTPALLPDMIRKIKR